MFELKGPAASDVFLITYDHVVRYAILNFSAHNKHEATIFQVHFNIHIFDVLLKICFFNKSTVMYFQCI